MAAFTFPSGLRLDMHAIPPCEWHSSADPEIKLRLSPSHRTRVSGGQLGLQCGQGYLQVYPEQHALLGNGTACSLSRAIDPGDQVHCVDRGRWYGDLQHTKPGFPARRSSGSAIQICPEPLFKRRQRGVCFLREELQKLCRRHQPEINRIVQSLRKTAVDARAAPRIAAK